MKISDSDTSRIIEMAWEDRTPFDAIKVQFGLSHDDVVNLMRSNLKTTSFKVWRERVRGRKTKHSDLRSFKVGRHQSYDQSKHRKR
tara:strand:+ start:1523 stop:1780 length:258 start_codon:yes stop_codon:yes gene_type:complete